MISRTLTRGVPWGSVLSPYLWYITYDSVLRANLPFGAMLGYAYDMLILISSNNLSRLKSKAEFTAALVTAKLDSLELAVASHKTEALLFSGKSRSKSYIKMSFNMRRTEIISFPTMKYLGIFLDNKWCFKEHFARIAMKADKVPVALTRLMPNIGGP